MMLIPLIAIGLGLALWANSRHQVAQDHTTAPMLMTSGASAVPSPLVVLGELLRIGQMPPPFVIACAIAEAEAMGRFDVSSALVEAFVRPVVEAAQLAQARDANADPRAASPWGGTAAPLPASAYRSPMPSMGDRRRRHQAHQHRAHPPWQDQDPGGPGGQDFWSPPGMPVMPHAPGAPGAPAPVPHPPSMPGMPGAPGVFDGAPHAPHAHHGHHGHHTPGDGATAAPMFPMGPSNLTNIVDPAYGTRVEIVERSDRTAAPANARRHPAQNPTPNEGTITVSGMNSPIADIPNEAWADFASRVQRELPTFTTPRHVGQFRQRKDRLADLGFNPDELVSSPDLQRAAFAADMADAFHHASESGLVADYQGTIVEVPNAANTQTGMSPVQVTLSGVLGVIQAAGLEGAAEWLESPADRRRFPHTTAAFLRTNGAF